MPELDTQLRSYVESSIERVDVEDITAMVLDQPWVEQLVARRIRPSWVYGAAAAAVVILIGGLTWLLVVNSSSDPAAAPGTIEVTINNVERSLDHHLAGKWRLAGVLFKLDSDPNYVDGGLGGFTATLDSNPYSTTQLVRQPAERADGPFPYVTEDVLYLDPGDYVLQIWLGRGLTVAWSRWLPADVPGLVGCETILEVEPGQPASVKVSGGWGDVGEGMPPCVVEP